MNENERKGKARINMLVNKELQEHVRSTFSLAELPHLPPDTIEPERLIYGKQPDAREVLEIGKRKFGLELYSANPDTHRSILLIAQHGCSGRARDWGRLADRLNPAGLHLLAVDMHVDGHTDDWAMSRPTA